MEHIWIEDVTSHPEAVVWPVIDSPIIYSIPPLPPVTTAGNVDVIAHLEATNGQSSSDRTATSSTALHGQTPTPSHVPVGLGLLDQDKHEVM